MYIIDSYMLKWGPTLGGCLALQVNLTYRDISSLVPDAVSSDHFAVSLQ
jgi:hypothetical protein